MNDLVKLALFLGIGGFGLGAISAMDLEAMKDISAVDLEALNLGALEGIINDMKEAIRYIQEEGAGEIKKLLEKFASMKK